MSRISPFRVIIVVARMPTTRHYNRFMDDSRNDTTAPRLDHIPQQAMHLWRIGVIVEESVPHHLAEGIVLA